MRKSWVGLATVLLFACARSSRHDGRGGSTGHAGSTSSPAGSGGTSTGGMATAGGGSGGIMTGGDPGSGGEGGEEETGGTAGSGNTAGSAMAGGGQGGTSGRDGVAGSTAGTSGSDGARAGQGGGPLGEPGIVCGPWDNTLPAVNCAADEVCALCEESESNRSVRCAPNPADRPEEYEAFNATCTNGTLVTECDGPEDCADGTTCQIRSDDDYLYAACSPQAPTCTAYCVACNSNEDCEREERCVPNGLGGGDWAGATCGPGLNELLLEGDWLIGWSGGADHYSWFHFTRDDGNASVGIVRTLRPACVSCMSFGCEDSEGTYEVVAENEVRFEFSDSCTFSYRFASLSSPPAPGSGMQALVSAQVTVDDAAFASASAQLYASGVGCDLEFSSCAFPPP